jgi:serine/threonine protein kinase
MVTLSLIGQVIAGRFRIKSELARGGFGVVYTAEQEGLDRTVVVKFLLEDYLHDSEAQARFSREARIISGFDHKNIVSCYAGGLYNNKMPFLVFEYLEGQTLRDLLRKGPITWQRSFEIGRQVCEGLAHAHSAGIVHRDLKPENIFITDDDTIKILDFGLAHTNNQRLTATGTLLGTALYMSPEQSCAAAPRPQSDIYSLGCVLYESIAGRPPLSCDNPIGMLQLHNNEYPPQLAEECTVPQCVDKILFTAMAKDPDDRYEDAKAFGLDLAAAVTDEQAKVGRGGAVSPVLLAEGKRNVGQTRPLKWLAVLLSLFFTITIAAFSSQRGLVTIFKSVSYVVPTADRTHYYEWVADVMQSWRRPEAASALYHKALQQSSSSGIPKILLLKKALRTSHLLGLESTAEKLECLETIAALPENITVTAATADELIATLQTNEKNHFPPKEEQLVKPAYDRLAKITLNNRLYHQWAKAISREIAMQDQSNQSLQSSRLQAYDNGAAAVFRNIMVLEAEGQYEAITELLRVQCDDMAGADQTRNFASLRKLYMSMLAESERRGTNKSLWHSDLVKMAYPWILGKDQNVAQRNQMLWTVVSHLMTYHGSMVPLNVCLKNTDLRNLQHDQYCKYLIGFISAYTLAEDRDFERSYSSCLELLQQCPYPEICDYSAILACFDSLDREYTRQKGLGAFARLLAHIKSKIEQDKNSSLNTSLVRGLHRVVEDVSWRSDMQTVSDAFSMVAKSGLKNPDIYLYWDFCLLAIAAERDHEHSLAKTVFRYAMTLQERACSSDKDTYGALALYGYLLRKENNPAALALLKRSVSACHAPNYWKDTQDAVDWAHRMFGS